MPSVLQPHPIWDVMRHAFSWISASFPEFIECTFFSLQRLMKLTQMPVVQHIYVKHIQDIFAWQYYAQHKVVFIPRLYLIINHFLYILFDNALMATTISFSINSSLLPLTPLSLLWVCDCNISIYLLIFLSICVWLFKAAADALQKDGQNGDPLSPHSPFTDPLQTELSTQERRSPSHPLPYQFTVASAPPTRDVSAPENASQRRYTRRNASPALQSRSLHTQLNGEGQIIFPLNSRATLRTLTWSRAPDSQLRQCPHLSCLPRTRDMFRRALRISLQRVLLLCILVRLRRRKRGAGPLILNPNSSLMHLTLHSLPLCFCYYSKSLFRGLTP